MNISLISPNWAGVLPRIIPFTAASFAQLEQKLCAAHPSSKAEHVGEALAAAAGFTTREKLMDELRAPSQIVSHTSLEAFVFCRRLAELDAARDAGA